MPYNKPVPHSLDYEARLAKALSQLELNPSLSINKAARQNLVPPTTLRDEKNKEGKNSRAAYIDNCLLTLPQKQALVK
jgi:hypothetical protein